MSSSIIKNVTALAIVMAVTAFLWCVPAAWLGIDGLTAVQQRTIALFAFAALMWIVEVVPNWVTSLLVMVSLLLTVSDKGLAFCIVQDGSTYVPASSIMAAFADPVIMLFLGGFVLALVASKYGIDRTLARLLLRPFGSRPQFVLLGFLLVIALFSMFMSNTATAAMFLTFLAPVLAVLPDGDKGKVGLALSIPVAANLGGMGTPIGTPPNATAVGILAQHGYNIAFTDWAIRMIPFVIIMILLAWILLLLFFPFKEKQIHIQIQSDKPYPPQDRWRAYVAWGVFLLTIVLWMTEQWTGLNASVVALIPLAVYAATGVFDEQDIRKLDWSVLWLVAGGFALGTALDKTGLAETLVHSVNFSAMNVILVLVVAGAICYGLSNFISNSATAALLIPTMIVMGEGLLHSSLASDFAAIGGQQALCTFVAVAASLAMVLPISTPPNAMAASTKLVRTADMAKVGLIIGLIGLVFGYFWLTEIWPL